MAASRIFSEYYKWRCCRELALESLLLLAYTVELCATSDLAFPVYASRSR